MNMKQHCWHIYRVRTWEVCKFLRGGFYWRTFTSQYPMMLRTYVAQELICWKVNIQFRCHLWSMDLKIKMPLILTTFFLNSKYIHSCVPNQRFVSNLIISITLNNTQILDIVFFFFLTKLNLYVEKVEIQFQFQFQCHLGPLTWKKDANYSFYII